MIHGLALREPYVRRELFLYLGIWVQSTCKRDVFITSVHHMQFLVECSMNEIKSEMLMDVLYSAPAMIVLV
jgi:hypothetical protein